MSLNNVSLSVVIVIFHLLQLYAFGHIVLQLWYSLHMQGQMFLHLVQEEQLFLIRCSQT